MNAIRGRLMALGVAVVFVGAAGILQAMGMAYALEDCLAAAVVATVITAVIPSHERQWNRSWDGSMTTQAEWDAKFEEIVAEVGREQFGDGPLKPAQALQARVDAEAMVGEWEMAQSRDPQGGKAKTILQRLLAEQHEIAARLRGGREAR